MRYQIFNHPSKGLLLYRNDHVAICEWLLREKRPPDIVRADIVCVFARDSKTKRSRCKGECMESEHRQLYECDGPDIDIGVLFSSLKRRIRAMSTVDLYIALLEGISQ